MAKLTDFLTRRKETGLGVLSTEELLNEVARRQTEVNPFPLDVFNPKIHPFIAALNGKCDLPSSFIGLSLLCAYSTCIGTSYIVSTNASDGIYLPVWGCLLGISSSGKSYCLEKVFAPIEGMQTKIDIERRERVKDMTKEAAAEEKLPMIWCRDVHIPTLVRYVLNDNPKGVVKMHDELLEWVNGIDALSKKESTDTQFWLSTWNCKPYSVVRSARDRIFLNRPFVNVVGGTQYSQLTKLFSKDRDTTGFIFRLLFARPEVDRIAVVDPTFAMPQEEEWKHARILRILREWLPVEDTAEKPKKCVLTKEAIARYEAWTSGHVKRINALPDRDDRDIEAGVLGKIKEYALRFSAILTLVDTAFDSKFPQEFDLFTAQQIFRPDLPVVDATMEKAIRLADYFYNTAVETSSLVRKQMTAPSEVLQAAVAFKMGKSYREIGKLLFNDDTDAGKVKAMRHLRKWIVQYPKVFNAISK